MAIVLNSGNIMQTVRFGASQDVTVSGSSAQSTTIGTAGQTPNVLVRLAATTACRVLMGTNPTATSTGTLIQANQYEYIEVTPGEKIAAIQDSAGGKLNITVCIL